MSARKWFHRITTGFLLGALLSAAVPLSVLASDDPAAAEMEGSADPDTTPVISSSEQPASDIVRLDLPVVTDSGAAPFDFHIDPQMLIYETDAARYGGGSVEEGATLLFRNTEGEYDFSSHSDYLTLTNRGDAPIVIYVNAEIENLGEIEMASTPDFDDPEQPALYLAIVDEEGTEASLSEYMDVSYSFELPANDTYSFGLTGACNAGADWSQITVAPVVRVTWHVEVPEEEDADDENGEAGDKPERELYQETLPTEPVEPEAGVDADTEEDVDAAKEEDTETSPDGMSEADHESTTDNDGSAPDNYEEGAEDGDETSPDNGAASGEDDEVTAPDRIGEVGEDAGTDAAD